MEAEMVISFFAAPLPLTLTPHPYPLTLKAAQTLGPLRRLLFQGAHTPVVKNGNLCHFFSSVGEGVIPEHCVTCLLLFLKTQLNSVSRRVLEE